MSKEKKETECKKYYEENKENGNQIKRREEKGIGFEENV